MSRTAKSPVNGLPRDVGSLENLPIFLNMEGKRCLVVSGGEAAEGKVRFLLRAGAQVTLRSSVISAQLQSWAEAGLITIEARDFFESTIEGYALVVSAAESDLLNERVAQAARASGVFVNVVDRPELCDFIFPSIVDRSPIVVAISSGGAAPVLARRIRAHIEDLLPKSLGRVATLARTFRKKVQQSLPREARLRYWERLFKGHVADLVDEGREDEAQVAMERLIAQVAGEEPGSVHLVGAGPGNAELITLQGLRALREADVILYDDLIDPELLDYARRDARLTYVGKRCGRHAMQQEAINELMARLAKEGNRVVRLKGGDPFVFGRGGEEITHLEAQGIEVRVTPGITAACGIAAQLKLPLTYRGESRRLTLATGHLKAGDAFKVDWHKLADEGGTTVFYMGRSNAQTIANEMVAAGLPSDMPVLIVENGTMRNQRQIRTTASQMAADVVAANLSGPTLLIIGKPVARVQADYVEERLTVAAQ